MRFEAVAKNLGRVARVGTREDGGRSLDAAACGLPHPPITKSKKGKEEVKEAMSFEGLQERLTALQETTTQLKDLIDRLQNLKFQPGSVPLGSGAAADEENSASAELSSEISQILREEEDELELLGEEVEDLRDGRPGSEVEHTKTRLKDGVERLKQEIKSSRITFRKAQLAARRNLSQAQRLERELLIKSYSQPVSEASSPSLSAQQKPDVVRHRQVHQTHNNTSSLTEEDKQTVGASGNVTSALRRTHDLIAAELARSEFAHQTLTESSAALAQLDDSYGSLDTMLASSKDLLGTLLRSNKSDTWYLQTALYMLMATGAWLLFRRLLYGPMWWLVWLPLRLVYNLTVGGGGAVVKYAGSGSPSEAVVVNEGKIDVEGLPDESLPTIEVGREPQRSAVGGDPESLVEKVGKIVEEMPAEIGEETAVDDGEPLEGEAVVDQVPIDELKQGAQEAQEEIRQRDEL
ncbi:hypothetical protein CPAR01_02877 [Colletotrichum paranaense]|uniref:Sec20 C-terminal domain-containing protein n=1 Tax=Colletotrichum paranaense TaxID=1914294 RepID=A0ABQ9T1C2_9PEZI|nr:uncharacterized protein CPAR01_02877 [Colletotrichum paranaense]KAK1545375.1 hypothetical protein CPAR01_02877 [Colletotrichum paranaense]